MGQSIETFWWQTPRTFAAVRKGYVRRRDDDHRESAWLAVHVGILSQVQIDHIPSPAELIEAEKGEPKLLSDDQMLARLQANPAVALRKMEEKDSTIDDDGRSFAAGRDSSC